MERTERMNTSTRYMIGNAFSLVKAVSTVQCVFHGLTIAAHVVFPENAKRRSYML